MDLEHCRTLGPRVAAERCFADVARPGRPAARQWCGRMRPPRAPGRRDCLMRMAMEIDVAGGLAGGARADAGLAPRGRPIVPSSNARYLAANIPGARFVELPGSLHILWAGGGGGADHRRDRGVSDRRAGVSREPDRVLATVLFTDIVGSTRTRGPARRPPLARAAGAHHALVRHAARALPRPRDRHRRRRLPRAASTARRARSAARGDRATPSARSASRCAPACTPASARWSATSSAASPFTSARASRRRRGRRSAGLEHGAATWSPAPASSSRIGARHSLKGVPGEWRLYAVSGEV